MALPKASLNKQPFGEFKAKASGTSDLLRNKPTPPKFSSVDPAKLLPGSKTIEVKLSGTAKTPVTVEVVSAGFDAPVTVTIPAGEKTGYATVSIKDESGDYTATLVDKTVPSPGCTVQKTPVKFTVICLVALGEQPFDVQLQNLAMGATQKLRLAYSTSPSVDLAVTVECPGLVPPKQTITIPAKHRGGTFEQDVTLADKPGDYKLKLKVPKPAVLKDSKKDTPKGPIETSFKLGVKLGFHEEFPLGEALGSEPKLDPGATVNVEFRMSGTCKSTAKFKLTPGDLKFTPVPEKPPATNAAVWTVPAVAPTKPGKYEVRLDSEPNGGIEAEGKFSFRILLKAGFNTQPFVAEPRKVGEKGKLQLRMSSEMDKPVKLVLKCAGLDPKKQTISIPAKTTSHEFEVQAGKKPGAFVAELEAPDDVVLYTDGIQAPFRLASGDPQAEPIVEFAKKPIEDEKKLYQPGEVVAFMVQMSDDAHVDGSKFMLTSPAFAAPVEFTVPRGEGLEPIRVEGKIAPNHFENAQDKTEVAVQIVGDTHCKAGTKNSHKIWVDALPRVGFSKKAIKPAKDAYCIGETLVLRVDADKEVADGVRVTLKCDGFKHANLNPAGTVDAVFEKGLKSARAEVELYEAPTTGDTLVVTLTDDRKGCRAGDTLTLEIKIKPLPELAFDTDWIEPKTGPYVQGQHVKLAIKLSEPAPTNGARFTLTSTAFEAPIVAAFLPDETTLKLDGVLVKEDSADQFVSVIPAKTNPGCRMSSNAIKTIYVEPGAEVQFETNWIDPVKSVYDEGDKVKINVGLRTGAPVDAVARLDSPAFGKRAFIARFPAGALKQGGETVTPEEDLPGKAIKLVEDNPGILKLAMPGRLADIATRKYREIPTPNAIEVTLQRPAVPFGTLAPGQTVSQQIHLTGMRGCIGNETRAISVRAKTTAEPRKGVLPCQSQNDIYEDNIEYCNAHRLLIQERHGGKRIAKRGHDGQGTWEIVASDAAPKLHLDAAVSPLTIQMIAGKVIYTKDDQPHKTEILVKSDTKDHFCSFDVRHPEATAGYRVSVDDPAIVEHKHPHLVVLQRQVRSLETIVATGAKVGKAIDLQVDMELQQVPEHPGWIGYHVPLKKRKKKKLPKYDVRGEALAGQPLRKIKIKKRKQKYEKLLAKGVPLKMFDLGIGFISIADVIRSAQTIFAPRIEHYRVLLETCGIPDPKRASPKVSASRLEARIDVFPSEEFCLFLNMTPLPAMQFGNDGHYVVDGKLASGTGGEGDPNDPGRAANQTQLGGDAMDKVTEPLNELAENNPAPMGLQNPIQMVSDTLENAPGNVSPLENQKATESTTQNSTNVTQQMESRGGGVVQETPQIEVDRDGKPVGAKRTPLLQSTLPGLRTGKSHDRATPSKSKEQRVLPQNPKTRVFHPVYATGAFAPPPELVELDGWTGASAGLVVNGRPKTEFMKVGEVFMAVLYAVRHLADFIKGLQDMVPSWGWGVTFDVGFLEGGLRFRWGWKEFEDWRVFRWWQIEANVVLVRASIEVWVGIKWRALFLRFQFVAYAKITAMLPLKLGLEREGPDGGVEGNLEFGVASQAEVGIRMILIHENFLYANAAIKTGFYFKFSIQDPTERRMGLFWEVYLQGLTLSATFKVVGAKKVFQKERVLIQGNPEGVPWRQGTLFPAGFVDDANRGFIARRKLRHAWLRTQAEFSKLDDALSQWHDIQLLALSKRDASEYEDKAQAELKYAWPWTDDPEVKLPNFGGGTVDKKIAESALWTAQWGEFVKALEGGAIRLVGDTEGTGKAETKGRLGKKKVEVRAPLLELLKTQALALERVKDAIIEIDEKYISVLREIDREVTLADEEERPLRKEFEKQLDKAEKWGDGLFGSVTKVVKAGLKGLENKDIKELVELIESWNAGDIERP